LATTAAAYSTASSPTASCVTPHRVQWSISIWCERL
jgi:hypothetical protein